MNEEKLIFIISQPRAGSTFLQRLLSNNEQVNTNSESWLLLHCVSILKPELLNATFSNTLTQWAFNEYKKGFPSYDFKKTEKEYILSLYKPLAEGYSNIIDKTPRYWEIIDEIPKLFPKAKIIVLKRNPEDVLISIMKTWQLESVKDLSRFQRDLLLAPKKMQDFIENNKDNDNVLEVKFESLKQNLSNETQALYNWLQLPYSDEVLDTEQNNKTKGVFGDPYQNSNDTYKKASSLRAEYKLSKKQLNFISSYLNYLGQSLLNNYGYPLAKENKGAKSYAFQYFKALPHTDHHWNTEVTNTIKNKFLSLFNRL